MSMRIEIPRHNPIANSEARFLANLSRDGPACFQDADDTFSARGVLTARHWTIGIGRELPDLSFDLFAAQGTSFDQSAFEDDRAGVLTRDMIGVENLMWNSDYPHTEGVWPYSRKKVAQNFANIPEGDTRKMVHDNVARVFGFPMN